MVAVTDGAEWIQKFIDHHRFDAVRILDFPHAAECSALAGSGASSTYATAACTCATPALAPTR